MNKVTFCPHLILDMPDIDLENLEEDFIVPFLDFMEKIKKYNVEVCFSAILMDDFDSTYPWTNNLQPSGKAFVTSWYGLIMSKLSKISLIEHNVVDRIPQTRCTGISVDTNLTFDNFLLSIASHTLVNQENEEAVFVPTRHCCNYTDFIQIKSLDEIKKSQYTWYKFYPMSLPCLGIFPFSPPQNWKTQPIRALGPGFGYMDQNNREWKWDRLHNNHWDVQNSRQGLNRYNNISPDGNVL